ncbi:hypothetical protein N7454_008730 [Penicillium verhagenii]|nr:hypothetical protein N7454_008730 [Penicillium verhagenii]
MRPITKGSATLMSQAANRGWSRGVRTCSSGLWASTVTRHNGQGQRPNSLPRAGWAPTLGINGYNAFGTPFQGTQTRFLRKANYVEKIGDNERMEELLEALEVKDDKKDTRPKLGVNQNKAKWAEDMSKGASLHTISKTILP